MRILIGMSGWSQTLRVEDCIGVRHTQAHYIAKQLKRLGAEIVYCEVGSPALGYDDSIKFYDTIDIPHADHALIIEPIAFSERCFDSELRSVFPDVMYPQRRVGKCPFLDALRRSVSGCIATIGDAHCIGLSVEDMYFYAFMQETWIREAPNTQCIGWAADGSIFRPRQSSHGGMRILLDHPHYIPSAKDETDHIVSTLWGVPVSVRRMGRTSIEDIDPKTFPPTARYGSIIPHNELAEELGSSHIFCVTHVESMGLSVVEAAMCGDLIVAKKGYIRPVLLDPLEHVLYEDDIDWDVVMRRVEPDKCRAMALPYNRWDEIGLIIYETFEEWQ